jgi:hypothetical protein
MDDIAGLFKYLDVSKLIFFEKGWMLLTPPIYLNDPWDFRLRGRLPSEDEIRKVWREIETDADRTSVLSVPTSFAVRERQERLDRIRAGVTSAEFLADEGENYQQEIGKYFRVVSLTELPLSRLMWAHYADSHAGFVVELAAGEQTEHEGFAIRGMGTGLVAAKVKYPRLFHEISFARDGSNILDVCCSKHPLWEYEQEWRIVAPLRGSIQTRLVPDTGREAVERYCVPFKPKNLLRVIFGMRMKPDVKKQLWSMLEQEDFKHVQKQSTTIDPDTGELVLKPA